MYNLKSTLNISTLATMYVCMYVCQMQTLVTGFWFVIVNSVIKTWLYIGTQGEAVIVAFEKLKCFAARVGVDHD